MSEDQNFKLTDLLSNHSIVMFTSVNSEGEFESRPMTLQEVDENDDLWFFAPLEGNTVHQVEAKPQVNVTLAKTSFLSLSGTAEMVVDPERQKRLWSSAVEAWMQCEPTDPRVRMLKVNSRSAQYWKTPGVLPVIVSMAKARITGDQPDVGESGTVDL